MNQKKLFSLSELQQVILDHKNDGKRVVLCHGVFDFIHPGHINHLRAAKNEGDFLVVTVTADNFASKGPGRPVFNENIRAECLAALEAIDFVAISHFPTAVDVINALKPNVYAKGDEYKNADNDLTGKINDEVNAVESHGGNIFYTSEETFSSSNLINSHIRLFPDATEEWLEEFRVAGNADDIISTLDGINDRRALVIGEAIIDEYVFCDALGKSAKDPILAFRYDSIETYAGGSLAVANHLAGYLDNVGILTVLGGEKSREDFIRESLRQNVKMNFVCRDDVPTIHKRRFIDKHSGAKPFELYEMVDSLLPVETEAKVLENLESIIEDYDIVIVTDFGHGMMTPRIIEFLTERAKFLAVNTQANAGNRGFNTLTKYSRADYISIAGNELELEIREREKSKQELLIQLIEMIDCSKFTITLGKDGSLHYDPENGFVEVPALAINVLDRVGAGDAVLAITTPLVEQGIPWEVVGFIANLAGAEMVGHLGNRSYLDKTTMYKHVTALLK